MENDTEPSKIIKALPTEGANAGKIVITIEEGDITGNIAINATASEIETEDLDDFTQEFNISGGTLPTGWSGNGEKFANTYWVLKTAGHSIENTSIEMPKTASNVVVTVHGVCNGTTTNSTVTVYLIDSDGVTLSSDAYTPIKASASTATAVNNAAQDNVATLDFSDEAVGIKIELTVKGHNYVMTSITVEFE